MPGFLAPTGREVEVEGGEARAPGMGMGMGFLVFSCQHDAIEGSAHWYFYF